MAFVVPEKARASFEDVSQGSVLQGSLLLRGIVDKHVEALVTRSGRCKGGRFYECDFSYFGISLGSETFFVKDLADA